MRLKDCSHNTSATFHLQYDDVDDIDNVNNNNNNNIDGADEDLLSLPTSGGSKSSDNYAGEESLGGAKTNTGPNSNFNLSPNNSDWSPENMVCRLPRLNLFHRQGYYYSYISYYIYIYSDYV